MGLLLLLFTISFSSSLIAVLLLYLKLMITDHHNYVEIPSGEKLPPGSTGWPVIGESMEFLRLGRNGHPDKFIRDRMSKLSKHAFTTSLFGQSNMVVLCGAPAHKFLFSNEHKLVNSWWPRSVHKLFPSTSAQVKEDAKRMRSLMPPLLKPEALQRYVGAMDAIARRSVERGWVGKEEVGVFELAKEYAFRVGCRLFVSVDGEEEVVRRLGRPFGEVAAGIFSVPVDVPGTAYNRAVKASRVMRGELMEMVRRRKVELAENKGGGGGGHNHQDALSWMLVGDGGEVLMGESEIVDKMLGLLVGGHDTVSAAITFVIKYMAELPHVYHQVHKEQMEIARSKKVGEALNWEDLQKMKYTWNVACEVMRMSPPVVAAFKEALADFTYAGYFIPKGCKILWSANSTHKNPDYFPDPDKFDPSRFEGSGPAPYTFVPFGGGPRMCPGREYARLEILIFVHHVVKRFKWAKVFPHENIIANPMPVPAKGLPVRLYPHHGPTHVCSNNK